MRFHCHLCFEADLCILAGLSNLPQVTSDCRPWSFGGRIAVCNSCGTVQKPIDAGWRAEAAQIYQGYRLYAQSATQSEQHSFVLGSGFGQPRSSRILQNLSEWIEVERPGRMLDLGCGIGVTLSAFGALAPEWELEGFDPNLKDARAVRELPGVVAIHNSSLSQLRPGYRCITCFHVLEHIVEPLATLRQARDLLADDGILIVEVPYFRDNPFDLKIADHCTHFVPETVVPLLARAGLEVVYCSTETIDREITIIARPATGRLIPGPPAEPEIAALRSSEAWLHAVIGVAAAAAEKRPFGIFGTSIAGTMVAGSLERAVDFFVDEDPTRIGGEHLSRPILAPASMPAGAHLMLALVPRVAAAVARRLASAACTLYLPPPFPLRGNQVGDHESSGN